MSSRRGGQKGQAIVLVALMMTVLVGFVALAIDSARAFDGRRLLQDSVDAAALAAAESYQYGASWSTAQNNALQLFEKDNRLPLGGESCAPNTFGTPSPGSPGTPVVTNCTIAGGSGYVLTLSAADNGPAGQTFALSATRPLTVALMQVLGQAPTITLTAVAASAAGDQAVTPALAGISQAGCFGNPGTTPFTVSTSTTPYLTVVGDVVSNGAAIFGADSYLHVAGDLLTRCPALTNPDHVTYECWPGGATPPCAAGQVLGSLRSTANHFADPGYLPPPITGLVGGGNPVNNVNWSPGIYAVDPQFGSAGNYCYFLAGGVYEWQAGVSVNRGIVSNELKPPDEPVFTDNQTPKTPQFWNGNGATCAGSFALSSGSFAGKGIVNGNWSVVVTALRTGAYNGSTYLRESAPSMCRQVNVLGPDKTLVVTINNVPGATAYNVYAQPPGGSTCAGPFGLARVSSIPNPNWATETQASLGTAGPATFNSDDLPSSWAPDATAAPDVLRSYPPSGETAPFNGSAALPNGNPARAASPVGDRANENFCASAAGATATCPAALTPGAVAMYLTNGSCFNVTSTGDAHLFSGYQYNWLLNYEPLATTCSNTWSGSFNSAPIGMSYTPGASFRFTGSNGSQTASFGGVVAASILVQGSGTLALNFNKAYTPRPPGSRLTG